MAKRRAGGWGLAVVTIAGGLGCGGDDGDPQAWEPTGLASGSGTGTGMDAGTMTDGADDTAEGTGTAACEPGDVEPCLCPDGLSLGEQTCEPDGAGFGACACEGDEGSTGDPMPPLPAEICFLGADRAGTTCLPLQAFYAELPAGYEYPPPMRDDGQDRPPLGLIDIEGADPSLSLAPNFVLDELARLQVGRYAVVQPHAVESLQAMRDQAGSIGVINGYLSPSANAAAGGDLYARHQWGDGFDLVPNATTLGALSDLCVQEGGAVVEFETHLHCELSATPLDEGYFGPAPGAGAPGADGRPGIEAGLDAWIELDGHELWAPVVGFGEGEPRRVWTARDGAGAVLGSAEGRVFEAPAGAVVVEVLVGGRLRRSLEVR